MPRPNSTPALRAERRNAIAVASATVRTASDSAFATEQAAALQETIDAQAESIAAQAETIAEQATMLDGINTRVLALEEPIP